MIKIYSATLVFTFASLLYCYLNGLDDLFDRLYPFMLFLIGISVGVSWAYDRILKILDIKIKKGPQK